MEAHEDSDDGTAPSDGAVRKESSAARGNGLLDEQSIHIILTMIEAMLYLNDEALALYQASTMGISSQDATQSQAQKEATAFAVQQFDQGDAADHQE